MIILPCIEFFFKGGYLTMVFLLLFVFALLFIIIRKKRRN